MAIIKGSVFYRAFFVHFLSDCTHHFSNVIVSPIIKFFNLFFIFKYNLLKFNKAEIFFNLQKSILLNFMAAINQNVISNITKR